jgi:aspartate kinase
MNANQGIHLVLKFGGTSVGDAARIRAVAELVLAQSASRPPVVVVSAMGSTTDTLVAAAQAAQQGQARVWRALLESVEHEHLAACSQLLPTGPELRSLEREVRSHLVHVRDLCRAAEGGHRLSGTESDELCSTGELLSANIVARAISALGQAATAIDAKEIVQTDDRFGRARVIPPTSQRQIRDRLEPILHDGVVPVVTGFRGATAAGECTTLGRGGSDSTATIIGALLPAAEVWILTDVAGVMTADPRLVANAQVIPFLSYREALELAFFGARVLHPSSMELPQRNQVKVRILSSFDTTSGGTVIGPQVASRPGVRAVVDTRDARLYTVGGVDGVAFTKVGSVVLEGLEAEAIPTLIVTQSSADNVICFAVSGEHGPRVRELLVELRAQTGVLGEFEETAQAGIVVAVGDSMRGTPGIAAKLFSALAERGINVIAISQGSSELSVSAAVRSADVGAAVTAIHDAFQLGSR